RLVARRGRPRQHARRVRREAAAQAPTARDCAADRDRARRRLPDRMRPPRLGIRNRLLLVVIAAVAAAPPGLVLGLTLTRARTLGHDAAPPARTGAAARAARPRPGPGGLVVVETPDDAAADSYIWVFSNGRALERPRAGPQVDATAQALARGPARFAD